MAEDVLINSKIDLSYAEAEKKLRKLNADIERLTKKKEIQMGLEEPKLERFEDLTHELGEAEEVLEDFKNDLSVAPSVVKEQEDRVKVLRKEWEAAGKVIDRYTEQEKKADLEIRQLQKDAKATAEAMSEQGIEDADEPTRRTSGKKKNVLSQFILGKNNSHKSVDLLKKKFGALFGITEKTHNSVDRLTKRITNLTKSVLIFSVMEAALRKLRTSFAGVLQTTEESRVAILKLRAALLTMIQPVIDYAVPVITSMIKGLTNLTLKLANFISTLFGTSINASAQSAKNLYLNMAKTDGAIKDSAADAKKLNRQLAGFDELNVISSQDAGTGGLDGIADEYADMADAFDLVATEATSISDLATHIKNAIQHGDWYGAGALLAYKLDDLILGLDAEGWAEKLGEKINHAIDLARGFLETASWRGYGQQLGTYINKLIDSVNWDHVGRLIGDWFAAKIRFAVGFLSTLDWSGVGDSIAQLINGFFDGISGKDLAELVNSIANGIGEAITAAIKGIDKEKAKEDIKSFFSNLSWKGKLLLTLPFAIDIAKSLGGLALAGFKQSLASKIAAGLGGTVAGGTGAAAGTAGASMFGFAIAIPVLLILNKTVKDGYTETLEDLFDDEYEINKSNPSGNPALPSVAQKDTEAGKAIDQMNTILEYKDSAWKTFWNVTVPGWFGKAADEAEDLADSIVESSEKAIEEIEDNVEDVTLSVRDGGKRINTTVDSTTGQITGKFSSSTALIRNQVYSSGIPEAYRNQAQLALAEYLNSVNWVSGGDISAKGIQTAFTSVGIPKTVAMQAASAITNYLNAGWGPAGTQAGKSTVSGYNSADFKGAGTSAGGKVNLGFNSIDFGVAGQSAAKKAGERMIGYPWSAVGDTAYAAFAGRMAASDFTAYANTIGNGVMAKISAQLSRYELETSASHTTKSNRVLLNVKAIPMATGAVIPPNKEFLSLLGDNKTETEVVSPLSTIRQAVTEAGGAGNAETNELLRTLISVLQRKEFTVKASAGLGQVAKRSINLYSGVTG